MRDEQPFRSLRPFAFLVLLSAVASAEALPITGAETSLEVKEMSTDESIGEANHVRREAQGGQTQEVGTPVDEKKEWQGDSQAKADQDAALHRIIEAEKVLRQKRHIEKEREAAAALSIASAKALTSVPIDELAARVTREKQAMALKDQMAAEAAARTPKALQQELVDAEVATFDVEKKIKLEKKRVSELHEEEHLENAVLSKLQGKVEAESEQDRAALQSRHDLKERLLDTTDAVEAERKTNEGLRRELNDEEEHNRASEARRDAARASAALAKADLDQAREREADTLLKKTVAQQASEKVAKEKARMVSEAKEHLRQREVAEKARADEARAAEVAAHTAKKKIQKAMEKSKTIAALPPPPPPKIKLAPGKKVASLFQVPGREGGRLGEVVNLAEASDTEPEVGTEPTESAVVGSDGEPLDGPETAVEDTMAYKEEEIRDRSAWKASVHTAQGTATDTLANHWRYRKAKNEQWSRWQKKADEFAAEKRARYEDQRAEAKRLAIKYRQEAHDAAKAPPPPPPPRIWSIEEWKHQLKGLRKDAREQVNSHKKFEKAQTTMYTALYDPVKAAARMKAIKIRNAATIARFQAQKKQVRRTAVKGAQSWNEQVAHANLIAANQLKQVGALGQHLSDQHDKLHAISTAAVHRAASYGIITEAPPEPPSNAVQKELDKIKRESDREAHEAAKVDAEMKAWRTPTMAAVMKYNLNGREENEEEAVHRAKEYGILPSSSPTPRETVEDVHTEDTSKDIAEEAVKAQEKTPETVRVGIWDVPVHHFDTPAMRSHLEALRAQEHARLESKAIAEKLEADAQAKVQQSLDEEAAADAEALAKVKKDEEAREAMNAAADADVQDAMNNEIEHFEQHNSDLANHALDKARELGIFGTPVTTPASPHVPMSPGVVAAVKITPDIDPVPVVEDTIPQEEIEDLNAAISGLSPDVDLTKVKNHYNDVLRRSRPPSGDEQALEVEATNAGNAAGGS